MPFTPKSWQNDAVGGTKLNAAALIDLEQRVAAYADSIAGGGTSLVYTVAAASGDATGVTDTALITAAVALAKAAGGGIVQATAGQTYQVKTSGTTAIRNPSGSISTRNRVVALPSNVMLDMNGSTMKLVGAECSMVMNESAAGIGATLSSGLSTGGAITTLAVNALVTAIPSGSTLVAYTVGANGKRQEFVTTASAAIGATSLSITSITPTFAFPSGTGMAIRDRNVGLKNVILDNNNTLFTGVNSTMQLSFIDGLILHNVKMTNIRRAQSWIFDVVDGNFDEIDADGVQGQAWTFGDTQTTGLNHNGVYESQFGRVRGENITLYDTGNNPGNPFDLVLYSCTIDSMYCKNCSAGIKLQYSSSDVTVGTVVLDTIGELTALNSGFKIQGDKNFLLGPNRPTRISVGQIITRNCVGTGLYMYHTQDCSVGAYIGYNNVGLHYAFSDVVLGGGINDYVGYIHVDGSGGGGVQLTTDTVTGPTGYRLPYIKVTNPGQLQTTLSALLSTGGAITTLPVAAMPTSIPTAKSVVVTNGTQTQTFTTSGTTAQGATSLTISSATPTFAFTAGTQVLLGQIRAGVRIDADSDGSFGEIDVSNDQAVSTLDRGMQVTATTTSVATIERFTATGYVTADFTSSSAGVYKPPVVGPAADVQIFTATGTWTKPAGYTTAQVSAIAPGGGGGSGVRGPAATARVGGGGGGGGAQTERFFQISDLAATVAVTINAAGTGGAAQTVDGTAGVDGTSGGFVAFGPHVRANGGTNGTGGGLAGAGGAGGAGGTGWYAGLTGGAGNATGANGANGTTGAGPGGGGGGGGITTGNTNTAGGAGSPTTGGGGLSGTAGATPGGAGGSGGAATQANPGGGGGGGAGNASGVGGTGGGGGSWGAGGGGGGATVNGNNSGAGADGAPGIIIVVSR